MSKHCSDRTNISHIVPRSRGQECYNVHADKNKIEIPMIVHEATHRLFANKTPQEQIAYWMRFNKQVISYDTRKQLSDILNQELDEFYIPDVLK